MTHDRLSLKVGKNDDIAETIEPLYTTLTGKKLDPLVTICLEIGVGKLEHQGNIYCIYKTIECPYQKESDRALPYCERREGW